MTYDVRTAVKVPKQTIKPEMLVKHAKDGRDIGLVVQVTRKYAHVVWLVNADPGVIHSGGDKLGKESSFFKTRGLHHFVTEEVRGDLVPLPAGTVVTITQTVK